MRWLKIEIKLPRLSRPMRMTENKNFRVFLLNFPSTGITKFLMGRFPDFFPFYSIIRNW